MPDPTPAAPASPAASPPITPAAPPAAAPPASPDGAGGNGAAPPAAPATVPVTALKDWRDGLEGEAKEVASRYASPADIVKATITMRKDQSQMIRRPENLAAAPPEEVQKFRKALGIPDAAGDYEFDLGREATEADKAIQAEVAKIALEANVSKDGLKALSKGVTALALAQAQEADRVALKARETAASALKKEMGADYDGNLVLAKRALDKFGGPDLLNVIENATMNGAKLGDHPAVIKAFAIIGRRMGEGDFIGAVGSSERTQAQERINQLMTQNPPGTEKYKDPAVQRELGELHAKLYGTEPTGGGFGGRTV